MKTKYECPECKRPIVSRRNKRCQYCGAEIPESLLYTKAEIEAQNREWQESEKNRKVREKEREEEEHKKRDDESAAAASIISMM